MNVQDRVSRARTHLLLDHPWFGTLALRLKLEAGDCDTMSVDGVTLKYNEEWTMTLTDKELIGVMAHETMHCAMLHIFRENGRDHQQWNEACDYAINGLLLKEGFRLPEGALVDPQWDGMAAEEIFAQRKQEQQDGQGGSENPSPSPTGDFQPAPAGEEPGTPGEEAQGMDETDWQIAAEQASAVARKAGKMSGDVDRLMKTARVARTDWRAILREFVEQVLPSDYSWTQPNRRYISSGLYLPGMIRENLPKIGIAVDTSGSVDQRMLADFASELTAILHEARPESMQVVYCDSSVKGEETFSPEDSEVILNAKGGGGTAFQPALDRFNEDPPICVIYLTDLDAGMPKEPDYPVLWCVPEYVRREVTFGQIVRYSNYA